MDKRSDRGEFYPGGDRASAPAPGGGTEKVDRVNVGEIGESYTLKTVKDKVDQIVRVIAPAATCIAILAVVRLLSPSTHAATAPLEDIPNTAHVVTNEEDTVALAALATASNALAQSQMSQLSQMAQAASNNTANALQTALGALAAESNRVETTYAKRSEIPTEPDLAPYALKSELPTDYVREGDITNFATRAWITAQGYATEAGTGARLDAQDVAIGAATNAQNAVIASASNALATAHAGDMAKVGTATNALAGTIRSATNALEVALRTATNKLAQADARLDAKIDALELTGGMTRLWTSDATTFQDATGVVWQVSGVYGWRGTAEETETEDVRQIRFDPVPGFEGVWTAGGGTYVSWDGMSWTIETTNGMTYAEGGPDQSATNLTFNTAFEIIELNKAVVRLATNAVNHVAYTNDIPSEPDFTTANAQLVATIEEVAPSPGNYAAVSNSAMKARSATELGVRGTPQGEGSWFIVNGEVVKYKSFYEWESERFNVLRRYDGGYALDDYGFYVGTFFLDSAFSSRDIEGYVIIGYTNTLAQVSQIPDTNTIVQAAVRTSTNYTGYAIGEFSRTGMVFRSSAITDGTNTIDAAGNVYDVIYRDAWIGSDGNVFTNVSGSTMWVSIYDGPGNFEGEKQGYILWVDIGEGKWLIDNESSDSPHDLQVEGPADATSLPVLGLVRRDYIGIIGKLALTNDLSSYTDAALTNYATKAQIEEGWWSEWTVTVNEDPESRAYNFVVVWKNGQWQFYNEDFGYETTGVTDREIGELTLGPIEDLYYTATRHRVAAPVPTKPSDIGAATNQDVTNAATWAANLAVEATREWRVSDFGARIGYVTNGMANVVIGQELAAETNGWPDGASMFVRCTPSGTYTPLPMMRLVGYGVWPTNRFQSVWWRSGTNIYVNVLLEERQ